MEKYTGIEELYVSGETIDRLYEEKKVKAFELILGFEHLFSENTYVVLKDENKSSQSALVRKKGKYFHLLPDYSGVVYNLEPKNKEQTMMFDALLDPSVRVVVLTGIAGTGKSIASIASSIYQIDTKKYRKIIYTRPMTQITVHDLGTLPGAIDERFSPYLQGFFCNAEYLTGGKKQMVDNLIKQGHIEFLPLQLFRGASFHDTLVIVDESQTLTRKDILAVGTRIGKGSKLILCGDLNQRDEYIARHDTGLYHTIHDEKMRNSPLVACVELVKSERGEVSALFADTFSDID